MADHDAVYKQLFAHPRMVRDLIEGFVREPWVATLDLDTLERLPASFIAPDRRRRESDMVWRARLGDDWVYLYLVLEFQSTVDPDMGLRLLVYTGLLLQDLIARGEIRSGGPYPPVLPLVFYTGDRRWLTPTSLAEQRVALPAELASYQLNGRYLLLDEGRFPEGDLPGPDNLAGLVVRAEQAADFEAARRVLRILLAHLAAPDLQELRRAILSWARTLLEPTLGTVREEQLETAIIVEDPQMLRTILAQERQQLRDAALREGEERGRQVGRQEGRQEQARESFLRLLELRFGTLPVGTRDHVAAATFDELDRWTPRLFSASSVEAVLAD